MMDKRESNRSEQAEMKSDDYRKENGLKLLDKLKSVQARLCVAAYAAGNQEIFGAEGDALADELIMLSDEIEECIKAIWNK